MKDTALSVFQYSNNDNSSISIIYTKTLLQCIAEMIDSRSRKISIRPFEYNTHAVRLASLR